MKRSHLEDALLAELVAADLQHYGKGFEDKDASDERQQQLLADDDGDGADGASEGEGADVSHEDFGGVGVVPEEADAGADHASAEDGHLADERHALKLEVVRENDMSADVGKDGEGSGGYDGAADGEAVKAVGEIDGVARKDDDQDDEDDERQEGQQADVRNVREGAKRQMRMEAFDERNSKLGGVTALA